MKVCLIGGAGGHLRELLPIADELSRNGVESFFVTFDTPFTRNMENTYLVRLIGPDLPRLLVTNLLNLWKAMKIIRIESPDVVITTGSEFAIPYCLLCKIRKSGSKAVFIESLCRINSPSGTGRIIWPFVDLYLVQWSELLGISPRKAKYWGRMI